MRVLLTIAGAWLAMAAALLPTSAQAQVQVFACEPEWGALAQAVGAGRTQVTVATTARQDAHYVRAKPSLLAAMRRADLVICSGAALESGWLPILLRRAGGPGVQPGAPGHLMAADHVPRLGVMAHADRAMGHVHPEGNPHVHLNPHNIARVGAVLSERLAAIDPQGAQAYRAAHAAFARDWAAHTERWEAQAASLSGRRVVVMHQGWDYLLDWLGMEAAASLEPKPGLPPTARHMEAVAQAVEGGGVVAIWLAPHENPDAARWLSDRAGLPVLDLPYTVGGDAAAGDLVGLFDVTLGRIGAGP
jgi:zinc/manganese transport system substrate-binding protein